MAARALLWVMTVLSVPCAMLAEPATTLPPCGVVSGASVCARAAGASVSMVSAVVAGQAVRALARTGTAMEVLSRSMAASMQYAPVSRPVSIMGGDAPIDHDIRQRRDAAALRDQLSHQPAR